MGFFFVDQNAGRGAWVYVALGLVACGGHAHSESSDGVPEDRFSTELSAALCDAIARCCNAEDRELDRSTCLARATASYSDLTRDARRDQYIYDSNAAGKCLDAWQSARDCNEATGVAGTRCESAFKGKLAAGEPCQASVECQSPTFGRARCARTEDGERRCVREPRQQAGESCYWTCTSGPNGPGGCGGGGSMRGKFIQGACYQGDGLYCSSEDICEEFAESGDPCTPTKQCKPGTFCDYEGGVCRTRGAAGDPCTNTSECEDRLVCTEEVCAPALEGGSPCVSSDACASHLCLDGTCLRVGTIADAFCAVEADSRYE
jgi:hypothetical protein